MHSWELCTRFFWELCAKKRDAHDVDKNDDNDNDDDDNDNDDDIVQKCGVVPAGLLGCRVFA